MQIVHDFEPDRARRTPLERDATLRDDAGRPFDVVVEDLSVTGCRIRCDRPLSVGMTVSIGVEGAIAHLTEVVRVDADGVGCAFSTPLSGASVAAIAEGRPVAVVVPLPLATRAPEPPVVDERDVPAHERWSLRARLASIVAAGLLAWLLAGGTGYAIYAIVA